MGRRRGCRVGRGRGIADIYSRLIFMVTIFAFNRKSMKFSCLHLVGPFILFMFLRISACAVKNIYTCVYINVFHAFVWCNTHTHTCTVAPGICSLLYFPFCYTFLLLFLYLSLFRTLSSNLGNLAA